MISKSILILQKRLFLLCAFPLLTACPAEDLDYLWHISQGQLDLLNKRSSIQKALRDPKLSEDKKKKLRLIDEIKDFAQDSLKLDIDENIYSSYVQLKEPYVSWLIRVSPIYKLEAINWSFPLVGSFPYKGFFSRGRAERELKKWPTKDYDTYLRGVRAYSTLSWFEDPILSSMLDMSESGFSKMIFHELAHTVLFFKNQVNFNERFAEWIAGKAVLLFYIAKEGKGSKTAEKIQKQEKDKLLFSAFIEEEYKSLKNWYESHKEGSLTPALKQKRLQEIQTRFLSNVRPLLQTSYFLYFSKMQLNNAIMLSYRSYHYKMDDFERVFHLPEVNQNIKAFVDYCAQFEKEDNAEEALKKALSLGEIKQ